MSPVKSVAVCNLFVVAEDILAVDPHVGESSQKLLKMLSQARDPTLDVAETVMQNAAIVEFQVAFQVLRGKSSCGVLNSLYILVSGHSAPSRNRTLSGVATFYQPASPSWLANQ